MKVRIKKKTSFLVLTLLLVCGVLLVFGVSWGFFSDQVKAAFTVKTRGTMEIKNLQRVPAGVNYDLKLNAITPLSFTVANNSSQTLYYATFFDVSWDDMGTNKSEADTFYAYPNSMTDTQVQTNAAAGGSQSLCPSNMNDTLTLNMSAGTRLGGSCAVAAIVTIAANTTTDLGYKIWLNGNYFSNPGKVAQYKDLKLEIRVRLVVSTDAAGTNVIANAALPQSIFLSTNIGKPGLPLMAAFGEIAGTEGVAVQISPASESGEVSVSIAEIASPSIIASTSTPANEIQTSESGK